MPRPTSCPEIHVAVFAFAAALIGLGAYLVWPRPTVVQQQIQSVECNPFNDIAKTLRESPHRNPMQGRTPDFPGGLK